jgi:hypothetical protein
VRAGIKIKARVPNLDQMWAMVVQVNDPFPRYGGRDLRLS